MIKQKEIEKDLERVQEMLDSGLSRNKVASMAGVDHKVISRLIEKGRLEIYTAFDEYDYVVSEIREDVDSVAMDDLDSIISMALISRTVIVRDEPKILRVSRLLKKEGRSILSYLKEKDLDEVSCSLFQKCNCCEEEKTIKEFPISTSSWRTLGVSNVCATCNSNRFSIWTKGNRNRMRAHVNNRRAFLKNLPHTLTAEELGGIGDLKGINCLLCSGTKPICLDHFVPLKSGHVGTTIQNSILICKNCNSSKNGFHPITWSEKFLEGDELSRFVSETRRLAKHNALTYEEYRSLIDWCFDNPREVDEVIEDNERYGYTVHSIELWRESSGVQFPLPKFALIK